MSAPEMPAWLFPPVAWQGPPVGQKYSEPAPLSHAALLEFRDSLHEDSVVYAASGAEIDLWLAQLDEAIDVGEVDPRPSWEIAAAEERERLAEIVVAKMDARRTHASVVRAEFITAGNAEAITGQDWRWVVAEARRLGVPVGGTGHKRVVDVQAFRAALAADSKPPLTKCDVDPVEEIRRTLGSTRVNGAKHGH